MHVFMLIICIQKSDYSEMNNIKYVIDSYRACFLKRQFSRKIVLQKCKFLINFLFSKMYLLNAILL